MDLISAIKSGKRFRRRPHTGWFDPSLDIFELLTRESIVADDWEIEEPTITITRSQLEAAFGPANHNVDKQLLNVLATRLGFK